MSFSISARGIGRAASRFVAPSVGLALAIQACANPSTLPTTASPRPLGIEIPVYRPAASPGTRPSLAAPTDSVSLREAVALALLRSPSLAAFAWESRASESLLLQAGARVNPVVGVGAEDIGAGSAGTVGQNAAQPQTTVTLSQLIELGGKRTARRDLATRNRDLAAWDYETARINVLTRVTHAFIDVLVAQRLVALTEQTTRLVSEVQQSVGARVVAGVVSPIEETKANVALAASRVESNRARRLLESSRAQLAAAWGARDAPFAGASGTLETIPELPPLTALRELVANNPDVSRWNAEIAQRSALLAVEQARRIPDVALGAGYRRYTDARVGAYVVEASIPLPIFDRNRGATDAAQNRLGKAYEERGAVEARAWAQLADAYRTLAAAHDEITVLRETVFPGSQEAFDRISEGYRLGRFAYLDVLDAQRTLIAAGSQYLRALAEYHKAVADIERLIGAPLSSASR